MAYTSKQEQTGKETDTVGEFVQRAKEELNKNEPVTVPREYMFAGIAGAAVLIVTAWPVLILGAVLGALGIMKLGCPNLRK